GETGDGVRAESARLRPGRGSQGTRGSVGDRAAPLVSSRMVARLRGRHVTGRSRTLAGPAGGGGRVAMLRVNVVTLFPDWFTAPLSSSILGRAAAAGLVKYRVVQLRDYTHDKHHTVDDAPYGGGAGMVLKVEPLVEAVEDLKTGAGGGDRGPIVLLSARGKLFTHDTSV